MPEVTTPSRASRSADQIFTLLDDEFRRQVVTGALQLPSTDGTTDGTRKQLDAEIRRLRVDGFRDASRAPQHKVMPPILDAIEQGNGSLASVVLDAWVESSDELRSAATAQLTASGISVPDVLSACFDSFWAPTELDRVRSAMKASDESFDGEAVELMLCWITRRFPEPPPLEAPLFREWTDGLRDLSPEASEWVEVDVLLQWVHHIRQAKQHEDFSRRLKSIADVCAEIRKRFDGDLRYLEIDPDSWTGEIENRPALAGPTLQLVCKLRDQLDLYRQVRPQAVSRNEEIQRLGVRQEREGAILQIITDWQELKAQLDPPDELAVNIGNPEEERDVDEPLGIADEKSEAVPSCTDAEAKRLHQRIAELQQENVRLLDENQGLESEKAQHAQETQSLKTTLFEVRRTQKWWRQAYIQTKRHSRIEVDGDSITVDSVRTAISLAEETFSEELQIQLNSKSDRDIPFERPQEVFDVLAWLATAYHRVPPDQFKEVCPGWFYRPNQSDSTIGKYWDWYQTQVNGTTWSLLNHIGKGNSHDPRHTIRIAFAWDEENTRVIVGYVGLHQRNHK